MDETTHLNSLVDELGQKHGISQAALVKVKGLLVSKLSSDELKPAEVKTIAKDLLESQINIEPQHED
jgi:hypothetical protein